MDGLTKPQPLRILMTTDTVGGVWSYAVALCEGLQPYGVQFYLVTTGAPVQPKQRQEVAALLNVSLYETDFLLEWMEAPWQSIDASAGWLLELETTLQPHLIHINGYAYGALAWKAPVMVVAHSDVFSWWEAVKGTAPTPEWELYFQRVRAGLQGADLLVAPSAWMMAEIRRIYAVDVPGRTIYNGRRAGQFYPGNKEKTVFSMGRIWDDAKNIRLLVAAAPQIRFPILLAGDTHFEHNDTRTAGANIRYLGKLSTAEVAPQLAAAAVYVLPARYEPFGLSILEAALSGCALVLGKTGSLQEIWGAAAWYVDMDDADALAAAVNQLLENEPLRLQYAQAALERATLYNTERMAAAYREVYHRLLHQTEVPEENETQYR